MSDESITADEYRDEIKSLAAQAIETAEEDGYDDIYEAIWSVVDTHKWIIYYAYNIDVLRYADNDPEGWRGRVEESANWRKVIQIMAYCAMEHDCYDAARRIAEQRDGE